MPENALANDRDTEPFAQRLEYLRRGQHATRKNIALDEVDLAAIGLEQIVPDGNGLDAGEAARQEPVAQLREISGPELLTHRFDHLDRGYTVIPVALVAVILQSDFHSIAEARGLNARLRKIALFLADGKSHHLRAKGFGGILGEASPAAPDLQHFLAGPQVDRFGEPAVFVVLGRR
ncbi:hypothetical protein GALL_511980 [mine drainage metagenome]|uniref:Uncharacterized protein n=1 Tax=mine drainage metagenome TaxID=410659 RepID=A0A1J5P6M9_9ZZZZ